MKVQGLSFNEVIKAINKRRKVPGLTRLFFWHPYQESSEPFYYFLSGKAYMISVGTD